MQSGLISPPPPAPARPPRFYAEDLRSCTLNWSLVATMSTFPLVNPAPLTLLADPPMWHASFMLVSGAALSPYKLRVEGFRFKV